MCLNNGTSSSQVIIHKPFFILFRMYDIDKFSHAHLNAKLYPENLKFSVKKFFQKYLKKANPNLLRKCTYKIC